MHLKEIREEKYAVEHWKNLRPFFCILSPEYIWKEVRNGIIDELTEELRLQKSGTGTYRPFFTYPDVEQLARSHRVGGSFFSEELEIIACTAAEALGVLAGLVRLESKGDALDMLEECFHNLWGEFSKYSYGHGIEKANTTSYIVSILGCNNVFELVKYDSWKARTLEYFETEEQWGKPLRQLYKPTMRILGYDFEEQTDDDIVLKGILDLNMVPAEKINELCRSLYWERSKTAFSMNPPRLPTHVRTSFYHLPFNLVKINCENFWKLEPSIIESPFNRIAMHLLLSLNLRSTIVSKMGISKPFTIEQAAIACNIDEYSIQMTLGQMIKVGLVDFDRDSGEPWYGKNQQFTCRTGALAISDDAKANN